MLPSVDSLVNSAGGDKLGRRYGRTAFLGAVRSALDALRIEIADDSIEIPPDVSAENVLKKAAASLEAKLRPSLRAAVNATGIIMHSGLGRAVLSEDAGRALSEVAGGYSALALDMETGKRSPRDRHVRGILMDLTGAEDATVVNNNAAATVLVLNTLAKGKEVIVSRGQLVEIGGSFRMPEVMAMSGAILREVGATNKTHLRDYEAAIGDATGAILRVHHSNFRIVGFAEEPGIEALVRLGREKGVPVIDDIGSGALVDLKAYGLETEPMVQASVLAGADVVCFSGDKLIGGPQSGIIVGRGDPIQAMRKNPLARAFRCGKLTLAALEATLKLFLHPETLDVRHPIYRMLSTDIDVIGRRVETVISRLRGALPAGVNVEVVEGGSQVGSGSVPVEILPTRLLSLRSSRDSPAEIGRNLRGQVPAVFTRIHEQAVLFDFRTVQPDEDNQVEAAIIRLFKNK
jgi:L-seryl-tRNA(Ser) seleniumtransferase